MTCARVSPRSFTRWISRFLAASACILVLAPAWGQTCEGRSASGASPSFPLHVERGQHYLEDAGGKPFFMHGDTAWSLIAQTTREEADAYLRDRAARGFNTVLVNLLEHRFASNAPANAYGDEPFLMRGDYASPNEGYFDHAEWVVRRACDLGMLVLLAPSYLGGGGGPEGWYQEMKETGLGNLRRYGRFLGQRFGHLPNIVWVHGGDYNPPDKDLVRAIVKGINDYAPNAVHTAHTGVGASAAEYWSGEPWLSINSVYPSKDASLVYETSLAQHDYGEHMPFFLIEGMYENNPWVCACADNDDPGADELGVRMQAYQAVLSGASGHVFGNNPIWHFDGPGWHPVPMSWQEELDSAGARSMGVLHDLVLSTQWWLLEPDMDDALLVGGRGSSNLRAVAAEATDGSFALVYTPTARDLTVDLTRLSAPLVSARWHDPTSGQVAPVEGSPFPARLQNFVPKPRNAGGGSDWVLELSSTGS
jgi:uncharacterized protein DUF4038/collagenase-like protein with putative collagen-binding domain